MNIKEYIANNYLLLNDSVNILILSWIEKEGYVTSEELSKSIGITKKKTHEIIHKLYNNDLIATENDYYKISYSGIKLINKLGLRDSIINSIISKIELNKHERILYRKLLLEYRETSLNDYCRSNKLIKILNSNLKKEKEQSEFYIITLSLISNIANTIYNCPKQNFALFEAYKECYDYMINNNECYTRDIFNYVKFNTVIEFELSSIPEEANFERIKKNYLSLNESVEMYNSFLKNHALDLNLLLLSNSINDYAEKLNISNIQAEFIISYIKNKCGLLLNSSDC